jgi:hypothetical protein
MQVRLARRPALFVVAALATLAFAPSALAKTYVPNKMGDHVPEGHCTKHDCTLREAIIAANTHPGKDKIILKSGKTYGRSSTAGTNEDNAADGDLDVKDVGGATLTIRSTVKKKRAIVDAGQNERVFDVFTSAKLQGLVVRNGRDTVSGSGGGIRSSAPLTLDNAVVTGNVVVGGFSATGGGVAQTGTGPLVVSRSTISANTVSLIGFPVPSSGGGISSASVATISNSTINGNTATGSFGGSGGGIGSSSGPLTMVNDTVEGNSAPMFNGGGVAVFSGTASLNALTIARNSAGTGGGLGALGGTTTVRNSLIALNTASGSNPDCTSGGGSTLASAGHNLVGDNTGCTAFGMGPGDIVNAAASPLDLGTLKNNGGPTKTDALGKHSVAINNAGSDAPKRDQRGVKRHNPDIGAFERVKKH